jgi:hypothetical protein
LAIHEHVITNNARLSVTHNDYNTWTLNIRGVRREDRGQYMCQVNTDPMKSQVRPYIYHVIYLHTYSSLFSLQVTSCLKIYSNRRHPYVNFNLDKLRV